MVLQKNTNVRRNLKGFDGKFGKEAVMKNEKSALYSIISVTLSNVRSLLSDD